MTTHDDAPAWMRRPTTVGLLLLVCVLLAYLPGILGGTFHFDDMHHVRDNPAVRDVGNLLHLRYFTDAALWSGEPGNTMYRPVGMLPHAIDFQVWKALTGDGYHAAGWLLTNALLHATVAILVWRLALRLGLGAKGALLAAFVMALHPIHSEVVVYVSARSESTAAVLFLAALLVHTRSRDAAGGRRVAGIALAGALYVLAMLAKETAALFFVAVAWMELTTSGGTWRRRCGRAAVYGLVYALFFGGVMALRKVMLHHAIPPVRFAQPVENADVLVGGQRTYLQNWLTQSRVVVLYYQLLLRPLRLTVDHDVRVVLSVTGAVVAAVLVHLAVIAAALVALVRGRRLVPLAVGWFWILLAPSIVVPLNVIMNEHRLYLPGIAVALLAGAVLARVHTLLVARLGSGRATAAVTVPFLCFATLAADRSVEWHDDFSLWSAAVERAPQSARAHMHLGAAWHDRANRGRPGQGQGALDRALDEYRIAEALHPDWYDLQLNIGAAWLARGRLTHDRADLERALAAYVHAGKIVGDDKERPRYLQAAVLTDLGAFDASCYDRAITILQAMDEADDSVTTMYDDALARALRKKGDLPAAMAAIDRVIAIEEPRGKIDALLTAGWWCYEDGALDRSQGYLTRALDIAQTAAEASLRDATERRLFRAYLYVARFLVLEHQPGVENFLVSARKLGWRAPPDEVAWVQGGPTPGVTTGTR